MTSVSDSKQALRWADLVEATGLSRRWLERAVASGDFPKPTRSVGRVHLWSREVVERWIRGEDPAPVPARTGRAGR